MIPYKSDRENGPTRGTMGGKPGGDHRPTAVSGPVFRRDTRLAGGLTRRRVVDYGRLAAAL
jgi:hypothetical protein